MGSICEPPYCITYSFLLFLFFLTLVPASFTGCRRTVLCFNCTFVPTSNAIGVGSLCLDVLLLSAACCRCSACSLCGFHCSFSASMWRSQNSVEDSFWLLFVVAWAYLLSFAVTVTAGYCTLDYRDKLCCESSCWCCLCENASLLPLGNPPVLATTCVVGK